MKEEALKIIKGVLEKWINTKRYNETKKVFSYVSPINKGEYILYFYSTFCYFKNIDGKTNKEPSFISKESKHFFQTATLSDMPLLENMNADRYRLEEYLEKFDNEFYEQIEKEINGDNFFTSDPFFFV
ncbi:MAG: hypothetical protein WC223_11055 [Bacteroidales bacterium]|jgi:hypothetical protein